MEVAITEVKVEGLITFSRSKVSALAILTLTLKMFY